MMDPELYSTEPATFASEDDHTRSEWSTREVSPDAAPEKSAVALEVVTGRVKWFDVVRGFGFLVSEAHDEDILLHYNLLAGHGRKSLPEGTLVTAKISQGKRGRMATEILSFDLVTAISTDRERSPSRLDPQEFLDCASDFAKVHVRWFNRSKGYGFLLGSDGMTEIFVHMETVRRGGFETLNPGDALLARVVDGPRGPLAVQLACPASGPLVPDA